MIKSDSTVSNFTKEWLHGRFIYLVIMLSFKLVYYCVFFSCESNLISDLTKNVSYEFLVFHMLNEVLRCENIPKSWFKAPDLSLFIYLFICLKIQLKCWKYSLWSIMKNEKQPFTSVKKAVAEFFLKFFSQEITRAGASS